MARRANGRDTHDSGLTGLENSRSREVSTLERGFVELNGLNYLRENDLRGDFRLYEAKRVVELQGKEQKIMMD